ncbi:MAG: RNA polymerase sigma factor [Flavobacteriaceae bacterium]|nr:RNA polymerase sigma factor [Flavobacteriaceae bacterium]
MKVIPLYKNEDQLIKKASRNNREAQRQLYEMFAPRMLSVCRYYIRDVHQAEEVMLNGFLKVFTHIRSFRNEGSFEGWIRRIMVREAISFARRQKKIEFSTDQVENYQQQTVDAVDMEVDEIQLLIDELPEGYKLVFVMYAIEGYKHHEIAETLNISVGTSKSQLFKARRMLQEKIKRINKVRHGTT